MSYFTKTLQRLSIITMMALTPVLTAGKAGVTSTNPAHYSIRVAQAPPLPFPLDGEAVYVTSKGVWQEAILTSYQWHSKAGFHYTVNYQSDNSLEQNVPIDRIISLATAQQRKIATNVYDVSSAAGIKQMVDAHNTWRQDLGVKPLTWSPKLAAFAQEWADKLAAENEFKHRTDHHYGENLAAAQGQSMSPTGVVKMWGEEVKDYNYNSNSCKPGEMCGHYTQLVWHKTTEVGCAKSKAIDKEVWVCNYNPPGNYQGEKPY
jgi:pathogenesis-related protein 1